MIDKNTRNIIQEEFDLIRCARVGVYQGMKMIKENLRKYDFNKYITSVQFNANTRGVRVFFENKDQNYMIEVM